MNRMPGKRDGSLVLVKQVVVQFIFGLRSEVKLPDHSGMKTKLRVGFLVIWICPMMLSSQSDYFQVAVPTPQEISSRQIDRYCKSSVRKASKLSNLLEKINDRYLTLFVNREHELCLSFCDADEQLAERLITECDYALNRFENKLDRESGQTPRKLPPELDTLTTCLNFFSGHGKRNDVIEPPFALSKEFYRSEAIASFIDERIHYWEHVLAESPSHFGGLLGLHSCQFYFDSVVKERQDIFHCKSRLQNKVMAHLRAALSEQNTIQSVGLQTLQLSNATVPAVASKSPRLSLSELLAEHQKALTDVMNELQKLHTQIFSAPLNSDSVIDSLLTTHSDQVSGDSTTRTTTTSFDEYAKKWRPNKFRSKRFRDRIEFSGSFSNNSSSLSEIRGGSFNASILYRHTASLSSGFLFSYGYRLGPFNLGIGDEPQTTYLFKPTYLHAGQTLEWQFQRMIALKSDVLLNNDLLSVSANSEASLFTWRAGLKFTIPTRGRTKPSAEVLFEPMKAGTGSAFQFRIGFNLKSLRSG